METWVIGLLEGVRRDRSRENAIRTLSDVPDVFTLNSPKVEYLVADLIPRGAVSMISGVSGIGKSYLTLKMLVSVCLGGEFLGFQCEPNACLVLDAENSLPLVRERLTTLSGGPIPNLHIWGGWSAEPPPHLGSAVLQEIAANEKPLILFDTLNRFHEADENSASEMRQVMAELRKLANLGATVLLLHHCSRSQGSLYRGSSDILAAVDVAFVLETDASGLKLHRFKSRFSPERTLHIEVDFAQGRFELSASQKDSDETLQTEILRELIALSPGLSGRALSGLVQSKDYQRSMGLTPGRVKELLRKHRGCLWRVEYGPKRAQLYFPNSMSGRGSGSSGSTLRGRNHSPTELPVVAVDSVPLPTTGPLEGGY